MVEKRNRLFERKQTEGMTGTTQEQETSTAASTQMPEKPKSGSLKIEVHATATHHVAHKQLDPVVAHAQAHDFSHCQSVSAGLWSN